MATSDKTTHPSRARAERALAAGVDPTPYLDHPNYHVRRKAWRKGGFQLSGDRERDKRFLETLKLDPKKYLVPVETTDAAVLEAAANVLDTELHTDIPEVLP